MLASEQNLGQPWSVTRRREERLGRRPHQFGQGRGQGRGQGQGQDRGQEERLGRRPQPQRAPARESGVRAGTQPEEVAHEYPCTNPYI